MQCPSCGARLERMNPGIVVAVCAFCSTTLYREGPVLHAGEKSILAEPQSNLRVGSSGFVGDRQVELLGRIQFASSHGDAAWDEWYAVDLANGEKLWLVEDARSYTLERAVGPVDLPADFDPSIGRVVEHEGQGFEITEVGDAVCVGGQGHLGRDLRPGAVYRFVDSKLLGATGVLNLEFSPGALTGGAPLGFYGETVHPSAIRFEPVESFDSTPAQTGNAIQCVACGAGFSLRAQGEPVRTATCESCGSQLELSPAGIKVLSRNEGAAMFPFAVGDSMEWTGDRWEVMGRLVYSERDEDGVYLSREYLLWSPKGGYLWLLEYDGHYIVFRPTSAGPPLRSVRLSGRFDTFEVLDSSFKHFERGFQTLHYVDGALPWLARRGDKHEYVDLIDPPRILSVELTGEREQARFLGDYVTPKAIHEAFSKESPADPPIGVHAAQPSPVTAAHRWTAWACVLFAVVNWGIACSAGPGKVVYNAQIPEGMLPAQIHGSEAFDVKKGEVVGVQVVTQRTGLVTVEASLEPAPPDAERIRPVPVRTPPTGRIESRFLRASNPGWQVLEAEVHADPPQDVRVIVTSGNRSGRAPFWVGLLLLIYPVWTALRGQRHESRRWTQE
jgi:hypothetical protein